MNLNKSIPVDDYLTAFALICSVKVRNRQRDLLIQLFVQLAKLPIFFFKISFYYFIAIAFCSIN